jgi:hypothetical protein
MKASRCALAIAVVVSVLALATCAPAKYVPTANEEIYGTWTNPQAPPAMPRFEKIVCAPGGYKGYEPVTSPGRSGQLPAQTPHRPARAQLTHAVPQVIDSLNRQSA